MIPGKFAPGVPFCKAAFTAVQAMTGTAGTDSGSARIVGSAPDGKLLNSYPNVKVA